MTSNHWLLCALALFCCATLAAQVQTDPDDAGEAAEDEEDIEDEVSEFFLAYDSDRDGRVSVAEIKKAVADSMETTPDDAAVALSLGSAICLLVAADSNDDGGCSRDEYRALRRSQIKDADFKPTLSKADLEVLRKEQYGPVLKFVLDAADTDKDGRLSRDEYKVHIGDTTEFDKSDRNSDGFVDKAEMEADWLKELGASFKLPEAEKAEKEPAEKPAQSAQPAQPGQTPAQDDGSKGKQEPPAIVPEPAAPKTDPDSAWGKAGRSWVVKQTSKLGAMENISFIKTEVLSVKDGQATVRTQVLNRDRQPVANQPARESTRSLKEEPAEEGATSLGTETLTAAGREFECEVVEVKRGQGTVKSWRSKKYPGLLVKVVSKSGSVESTLLLDEFNE